VDAAVNLQEPKVMKYASKWKAVETIGFSIDDIFSIKATTAEPWVLSGGKKA
jgi:hypothetical protein